MSNKTVRFPQKGAVAKITEERGKLKNQPASKKLREIFKKENETPSEIKEKKIAAQPKKRDGDLDL
ncbi:MAG: hypothetical protein HYW49_04960 [Deltaproteobacteria bacterium]|nr:hypothetical protein [Deltaproteobacteria bacterium]